MRKILLLSLALVLICSLIAVGAIGNSNSKLQVSSKSVVKVSTKATISAKIAPAIQKEKAAKADSPSSVSSSKMAAKFKGYTGNVMPLPTQKHEQLVKNEGVATPPNPNVILQGGDNIGSATVISSLPYTDNGTTVGYTHDYTLVNCYNATAPDVIYAYTPAINGFVTVSLCGSSYDTVLGILDGSGTPLICNDDFCSMQSEIDNFAVTGGTTYYFQVTGYGSNSGAYIINVTTPPPPPTQGVDCSDPFIITLPADMPYDQVGQTTNGYVDDYQPVCLASYGDGPDVIYQINVTEETNAQFTIDPLGVYAYPSISLYAECPPVTCIAFAESYNTPVMITQLLEPGTYYLMADNWPTPNFYVYNLHIGAPLIVECPPNGIPEGEPPCADEYVDNYNGGCNSTPNIFQDITLGETICGQSGTYLFTGLQYRDTDWFRVTTDQQYILHWKVIAEFPVYVFIMNTDCSNLLTYASGTTSAFDTVDISANLPAGQYTCWVGPSVFTGVPCGSQYVATTWTEIPPQAPPNDECANVTPVPLADGVPLTFSGTDVGATVGNDCPGFATYPNVWEAFTIDECMNVTIDFCTTNPVYGNTWLNLALGCPCTGFTGAGVYNNSACGDGNWTITWSGLAPGAYYFPIMLDPANNDNGPYTIHITGVACLPPPPPDFVVTAPGTWTDGNTCGAGDDCSLSAGEDQMWEITIPYAGDWTFSLCNTSPAWDTKIYLGTSSCSQDIGFNDDGVGCTGFLSSLTVPGLAAGTYYLDVEPYSSGSCGAYQLDVTVAAPCVVTCPPNATPEGEPDCYDEYVDNFNGGCNSDPVIYSEVSLGQTICGAGGDYLVGGANYRDTDWYHFNVSQDTTVNIVAAAGFPLQLMLLNYDCTNIQVLGSAFPAACDTGLITVAVPAGDYTVWVGEATGIGTPCGTPYWFTLTALTPPPPPPTPCEGTNLVYGQADDGVNTMASQCDASYPFTAGMADDFILPGSGNVEIDEAVAYVGFWNGSGGQNPDDLLGFGVTIYADNAGVPGGQPIDGDPGCAHQANIDGGIVYTHDFAPGEFTWSTRAGGDYQVELPLPAPVTLTAGTTYWIEFYPQLSFSTAGQVGCFATSAVTGAVAVQGFPLLGIPYWTTNSSGVDVAFCLLGPSAPPPGCVYLPGDINGNGSVNGVDIVYAVNYFKGSGPHPPIDCFPFCPLTTNPFYAAGDVNGNCAFNGIDITYFVRYLKGQVPSLLTCADCPPAPGLAVTPKLGGVKAAPKNIGGQQ